MPEYDDETQAALDESLAHWLDLQQRWSKLLEIGRGKKSFGIIPMFGSDCPLCQVFADCDGCPLYEHQGGTCGTNPAFVWDIIRTRVSAWCHDGIRHDGLDDAPQLMIDLLKSLGAKEETE